MFFTLKFLRFGGGSVAKIKTYQLGSFAKYAKMGGDALGVVGVVGSVHAAFTANNPAVRAEAMFDTMMGSAALIPGVGLTTAPYFVSKL